MNDPNGTASTNPDPRVSTFEDAVRRDQRYRNRAADLLVASRAPSKAARRIQRREHIRARSTIECGIEFAQSQWADAREASADRHEARRLVASERAYNRNLRTGGAS